jgi:hypothetical protein
MLEFIAIVALIVLARALRRLSRVANAIGGKPVGAALRVVFMVGDGAAG